MQVARGKVHEFLGMKINFESKGIFKFTMDTYLQGIIEEFPDSRKKKKVSTPASDVLFTNRTETEHLDDHMKDQFHTYVAKLLYLSKRTRPDISLVISFLTTRVKQPNKDDWNKLTKCITYLESTKDLPLILSCNCPVKISW